MQRHRLCAPHRVALYPVLGFCFDCRPVLRGAMHRTVSGLPVRGRHGRHPLALGSGVDDHPATAEFGDDPEEGHVELLVYNMAGQKVRTIESGNMKPGYHSMIWNGTNDNGSRVSTGMYFYSIQTNNFQAVKKMLFLK